MEFFYGPPVREGTCEGAKCHWTEDAAGHRMLDAWDWSCPVHGVTITTGALNVGLGFYLPRWRHPIRRVRAKRQARAHLRSLLD